MTGDLNARRLWLLACAVGFAVSGCGAEGGSDRPGGSGGPAPTHLEIELRATAGAEPDVATLDCAATPSSTGFIGDAARACDTVADNRSLLLNGPPDNVMCTEIYGGPQRAQISGEVEGRPVRLGVSRKDGCAIATWDELAPLLEQR